MHICLNYYEKATDKYPDGRYVCVANDKIIHEDKLLHGRFPIHPVYDMEHPVQMWGEAAIRQALEVQRNLNGAETDLWTDRRMHAHPRLIVEQNSLVDGATRVPNTPGAINLNSTIIDPNLFMSLRKTNAEIDAERTVVGPPLGYFGFQNGWDANYKPGGNTDPNL